MKKTKWIVLVTLALLLLGACSSKNSENIGKPSDEELDNLNETGFPIVDESISLDFFGGTGPLIKDEWEDILVWEEYADMTNIDVDWEMVSGEVLDEKKNLKLGSSDLPDVFYSAWISNKDLLKYGENGVFIPLNDLIEDYAPNLQSIFEEHPEVKKALTFPDGNIYSLPTLQGFPSMRYSAKPFINEDFLEALDMDMPQTTDEFYTYLKAVKEEDPNGNGEADEIPFGAKSIDQLTNWIQGAFGLGQGKQSGNVDLDPETGDMRFYPISDEYKEMIEYVHKLYSEELIEQNIFSIEDEQYNATGSDGLYGSTNWHSPVGTFGQEHGASYIGMPALEGPDGYQMYTSINHRAVGIGNFAITLENEHPAATMRWIDHFYGDEGSKLLYMGIEGETYEETDDGQVEYIDEITDNPDGLTLDQAAAQYLTWVGGNSVGLAQEDYYKGSEASYQELEATEQLEQYAIDEVWPEFAYTKEENDKLSTFGEDIDKYVDEMRDKFISGNASLDEWDNYVKEIEKMNLDEYMEIKEAAYERYLDN